MCATIRSALAAGLLMIAGLPALAADGPPEAAEPTTDAAEGAGTATGDSPAPAAGAGSGSPFSAIEARGRTIFEHDRAAAVATDVAMAQRSFKRDRRVRGWLTEARDGGIVVTFIDEAPNALYRVLVSAAGEPSPLLPLETPAPLSAFEAGAATARRLALESSFQPCSKTYNTVVLPEPSSDDSWIVYLLPGTTRHNEVPIGGTYRVEVKEGAVAGQRAFTRSCIVLGRGPDVAGMAVTHLLDPTPTEAHVHWSLWAETPMYVSTQQGLWAIEQGKVRPVSDEAD